MGERVGLGAAGKEPGVGGGDIRRAGYTKVTTYRIAAAEERAGIARAAALARAAFRNVPGEPGWDG